MRDNKKSTLHDPKCQIWQVVEKRFKKLVKNTEMDKFKLVYQFKQNETKIKEYQECWDNLNKETDMNPNQWDPNQSLLE